MRRATWIALFTIFLGACAHVPDTSIYYFPATTRVNVKMTRLLACNSDNEIFSSQTVTTTTSNFADYAASPIALNVGLLNSTLADTAVSTEFYDDGRLKGINVTETGKAGEIIKSAVSLVQLVIPGVEAAGREAARFPTLCALIAAEKDKVVSLKYEADIDPAAGTSWEFPLAAESQLFRARAAAKGAEVEALDLAIARTETVQPQVPDQTGGDDGIRFRYPASVTLSVLYDSVELWNDRFEISQLGSDGWLPIARAPAFGKSATIIDLHENGSLKKVSYGSESGTKSALDSSVTALDLLDGATDAERTAAAEAEQKRIKAERDLLRCRTDPTKC